MHTCSHDLIGAQWCSVLAWAAVFACKLAMQCASMKLSAVLCRAPFHLRMGSAFSSRNLRSSLKCAAPRASSPLQRQGQLQLLQDSSTGL